jgi:hypothetical protein|tara:strand:+ start:765 stop:992 length:228 start_codon:yes stop_codon:yes gene_type:complete
MEYRDKKKEWLKKQLKEVSTSGGAGGYSTPFAFNPKKGANGTARNYYLDMGYTLVNKQQLRRKSKAFDYKDLWKK